MSPLMRYAIHGRLVGVYTCTENRLWAGGREWVEFVAGSGVPAQQGYSTSKHFLSSASSSVGGLRQLRKFRFWRCLRASSISNSQLQNFRFWRSLEEVAMTADGEYLTEGDAPSLDSVQDVWLLQDL